MSVAKALAARAITFLLDGLQGPTNRESREILEQALANSELRREREVREATEHRTALEAANARAEKAESRIAAAETEAGISLAALALACERFGVERDQLGIGLGRVLAERDDLRAKLEKALSILNAMPGDDIVSAASHMMDVRRRQSEDREAMRYDLSTIVNESFGPQPVMTHEELLSFLEDKIRERTRDMASYLARAEKAEAELRAIEDRGGALREAAAAVRGDAERIASLEADLTAARARIAELEAPMAEATVEELHIIGHYAQCAAANASPPEAVRAGIRAVAERVGRERPQCLIARAVASNIDVRAAEDSGGGFLVGIHRPGEDEDVERNVPAAEVPATLARLLDEGA